MSECGFAKSIKAADERPLFGRLARTQARAQRCGLEGDAREGHVAAHGGAQRVHRAHLDVDDGDARDASDRRAPRRAGRAARPDVLGVFAAVVELPRRGLRRSLLLMALPTAARRRARPLMGFRSLSGRATKRTKLRLRFCPSSILSRQPPHRSPSNTCATRSSLNTQAPYTPRGGCFARSASGTQAPRANISSSRPTVHRWLSTGATMSSRVFRRSFSSARLVVAVAALGDLEIPRDVPCEPLDGRGPQRSVIAKRSGSARRAFDKASEPNQPNWGA